MAQQTAVNILVNYMLENFHLTDEALEKFEQAKQMEKQQIIDSHKNGFTEGTCFGASPIGYKFMTSEQYYDEMYGE